jgi:hypothetical protein
MNRSNATQAAIVFSLLISAFAPLAQACRDCPFPMRVGDHRWIMPKGNVEVRIKKTRIGRRKVQSEIQLVDVHTGAEIASGSMIGLDTDRTMKLTLMDRSGHPIRGYVHFLDSRDESIEVKFSCDSCLVQNDLN